MADRDPMLEAALTKWVGEWGVKPTSMETRAFVEGWEEMARSLGCATPADAERLRELAETATAYAEFLRVINEDKDHPVFGPLGDSKRAVALQLLEKGALNFAVFLHPPTPARGER